MKTLLIRPGAIGDFIVSLPALECLRTEYTEVWCADRNIPLSGAFDRARSIASTGLDLAGLEGVEPPPSLFEALAGFDFIVSWYGTNRPEFRSAMYEAGLPFRFFPALPPEGAACHAVDYYLEQAASIRACKAAARVPRIHCPRTPGNFAVIHPFSGSARKNWPLDRFRMLADWIGQRMPVVWCAGSDEPLDNAVRFDNLYELACWLASARLFIGNDSGISHLAAAAGTPSVVIFGPTDPRVWAPRGECVQIIKT
ncbi:MAG: glycosyltransferase family 9 protein, partial [Bryobacteraceae bacterium]|nr:glycosyltransferase family 9 protein [Bryobacteraceae bacterium]